MMIWVHSHLSAAVKCIYCCCTDWKIVLRRQQLYCLSLQKRLPFLKYENSDFDAPLKFQFKKPPCEWCLVCRQRAAPRHNRAQVFSLLTSFMTNGSRYFSQWNKNNAPFIFFCKVLSFHTKYCCISVLFYVQFDFSHIPLKISG